MTASIKELREQNNPRVFQQYCPKKAAGNVLAISYIALLNDDLVNKFYSDPVSDT